MELDFGAADAGTAEPTPPVKLLCSSLVCPAGHSWQPQLALPACPACHTQAIAIRMVNCPICNEPFNAIQLRIDLMQPGAKMPSACRGEAHPAVEIIDVKVEREVQ
jgi:hypothetical protein